MWLLLVWRGVERSVRLISPEGRYLDVFDHAREVESDGFGLEVAVLGPGDARIREDVLVVAWGGATQLLLSTPVSITLFRRQ